VCYVITRRKLDNLRVNGKINKSSNLLNLVWRHIHITK
jgi:hypothetical protein